MIEKINQIRDLLIVPSVDEHPKLAINQMKILNLLVELRAEAEQCNIPDVSKSVNCDCKNKVEIFERYQCTNCGALYIDND